MEVYGLTGSIGSGKSTVAELFRQRGVPVVTGDAALAQLIAPGSDGWTALLDMFGRDILSADGAIDRARLLHLLASDRANHERFTTTLEPRLLGSMSAVLSRFAAEGHPAVIVDCGQLTADNGGGLFAGIIHVQCNRETAIVRLASRNGLSSTEAERRLDSQAVRAPHRGDDLVIDNSGTVEDTRLRVEALVDQMTSATR